MANTLAPGLKPGKKPPKKQTNPKQQANKPVVTNTRAISAGPDYFFKVDQSHFNNPIQIDNVFKTGYPDRKRLNEADVLTGFRANYKQNPQTWFNQGSSFLYQTLNRIPLIEDDLDKVIIFDLGENGRVNGSVAEVMMTQGINTRLLQDSNSKPVNYVYVNRQMTEVVHFKSSYYTGTETHEYLIDVTNKKFLVNRELQYNLGLNISRSKVQTYKNPRLNTQSVQEIQNTIGDPIVTNMDFQKPEYVLRLNGLPEITHPGETDDKAIVFQTEKIKTYRKLMQDYNSGYNPMFFGYDDLSIHTSFVTHYDVNNSNHGFFNGTLSYNIYLRYMTGNKFLPFDSSLDVNFHSMLDTKRAIKVGLDRLYDNAAIYSSRLANIPIHGYDSYTFLLADTNRYVKYLGEGITYSRYDKTDYEEGSPYLKDSQTDYGLSQYSVFINPSLRNYTFPILRTIHISKYDWTALYTENYGRNILTVASYDNGTFEDTHTVNANPRDFDGKMINTRNIPNDVFRINTYFNRSHDGHFHYPLEYNPYLDHNNLGIYKRPRPYQYNFTAFGKYGGYHSNSGFYISSPMDMLSHSDIRYTQTNTSSNDQYTSNITPFRVSHPVNTIDMRSYLFYYELQDPNNTFRNPVHNHFINHMHLDIGPSIDMREYGISQDSIAMSEITALDKKPSRYINRINGKNYHNYNGAFNPIIEATTNQLHDLDYDKTFTAHILFSKPYGSIHLYNGLLNLNNNDEYRLDTGDVQNFAFNDKKISVFAGTSDTGYSYPDQEQQYGYLRRLNEGHIVDPSSHAKYNIGNLMNYTVNEEGVNYHNNFNGINDILRLAGSMNYMMPFNSFMIFTPNQYMTSNQVYRNNWSGVDDKYNTYHTTFGGYFNNPIQEFNTPINNGLEYRLGYNPSFRAGMGLSLLAEKGNLMKPGTIGDRDYLNCYGHNYTGWGNMAPYVAQKMNMRTTVCLTTNASYSKHSLFKKLLKNSHDLCRQNTRTNSFLEPIDHSGFIKNNITIDLTHPTNPSKNVSLDFVLPSERYNKYGYVVSRGWRKDSGVIFYTLKVTKMKKNVGSNVDRAINSNIDPIATVRAVSNEGRRIEDSTLVLPTSNNAELVYDDTTDTPTVSNQLDTYINGDHLFLKTSNAKTKYHFTSNVNKIGPSLFSNNSYIYNNKLNITNDFTKGEIVFNQPVNDLSMRYYYRNSRYNITYGGSNYEKEQFTLTSASLPEGYLNKVRSIRLNPMDKTLQLLKINNTTPYEDNVKSITADAINGTYQRSDFVENVKVAVLENYNKGSTSSGRNSYVLADKFRHRDLHKVYNIEKFINVENGYTLQDNDPDLAMFEYDVDYEVETEYNNFKDRVKKNVIRNYNFLLTATTQP